MGHKTLNLFEKMYFRVTLDRHFLRSKSKSKILVRHLLVFHSNLEYSKKKFYISFHRPTNMQFLALYFTSHKGAKVYPRKCTFVGWCLPSNVLQLRRLLCVPLKLIFVELGLVTCTSFQHSQSGHQFCQAGVNDLSWNCHSFLCLLKYDQPK